MPSRIRVDGELRTVIETIGYQPSIGWVLREAGPVVKGFQPCGCVQVSSRPMATLDSYRRAE